MLFLFSSQTLSLLTLLSLSLVVCQVAGLSICWCCSCFFFTDTVFVVIDFDVIVFVDDNTGVPSSRLSITVRCQLCSLPPPTTSTSALSYNTLIYTYIYLYIMIHNTTLYLPCYITSHSWCSFAQQPQQTLGPFFPYLYKYIFLVTSHRCTL